MKVFLISLVMLAVVVSCGKTITSENLADSTAQNDSILYGNTPFKFPELTANARVELENWAVYDDFYSEASSLSNVSLTRLQEKTARMILHTDSLMKKIPDTLFTDAIYSRLVVIKTRTQLLQQEAKLQPVNSDEVERHIDETNKAVGNFIFQLNEKFLKDDVDLQRVESEKAELEKQKNTLILFKN